MSHQQVFPQEKINEFLNRSKSRKVPLFMDVEEESSSSPTPLTPPPQSSPKSTVSTVSDGGITKTCWNNIYGLDFNEISTQTSEVEDNYTFMNHTDELISPLIYKYDSNGNGCEKILSIGYSLWKDAAPIVRIGCSKCCGFIDFTPPEWYNLTQLSTFDEDDEVVNYREMDSAIYHNPKARSLHYGDGEFRCSVEVESFIKLFRLKHMVNYYLEMLTSYNFNIFYQRFIDLIAEYVDATSSNDLINTAFSILNPSLNINSFNILCILEILHRYPGEVIDKVHKSRNHQILQQQNLWTAAAK
ncbi:hypothetical protein PPYR_02347 [Photinus pyralis]|uniref:Uncharacterized protein n=1 Tax=Photinus pyralis TaxID=7054 RepID=A0A5N4B6Z5_PHOPY|nr:hypothetical protein PPYR_02347 [Photinus pyralis]